MMHVFILNVNAGRNNSFLIGKVIDEYCKSRNVNYSINYVTKKEDTDKVISKYKKYKDVVVYSVGGDGTLNQIINNIANTNLSLNVIPAGTGNDFYKSLETHSGSFIDLGKINNRYFINVASFGIDAEIANTANNLKNKNIKGKNAYILGILKNFFTYKSQTVTINSAKKDITILTICNGKFYGGGFQISPYSSLDDGLFDIYEVENINKIKTLRLILKLLNSRHSDDKSVNMYKTNHISINSPVEINCNLDGEIIMGTKFDFSVCQNAIKIDNNTLDIKGLLKYKRIIK